MRECLLWNDEFESVSHLLCECPVYSSNFLVDLEGKLGEGFEYF